MRIALNHYVIDKNCYGKLGVVQFKLPHESASESFLEGSKEQRA